MADHVIALPEVPVDEIRQRKLEATQRLLGATIAVSDEDWQQPTALPGWTRAHVATHLARNADALRRAAHIALDGTDEDAYPPERDWDIERGSERSALDLQIDLDTSAGRLHDLFDGFAEDAAQWQASITLPCGASTTLAAIPLVRLSEVLLHHVDLGIGFSVADFPDDEAAWLLTLAAERKRNHNPMPVALLSEDGHVETLGPEPHITVTGSPQALLGWVTGRWPDAPVTSTEPLPVPSPA